MERSSNRADDAGMFKPLLSVLLALCLSVGTTQSANADDWPDHHRRERFDHDRARDAVRSGEILPLGRILERVAKDFPGDIISAELDFDEEGDHPAVYEIKVIVTDGQVIKAIYDARDGSLIMTRQRGRGHRSP